MPHPCYAPDAPWAAELRAIRDVLLDCGLTETVKWNSPCFTDGDHNIALLGPYKDHANLGFPRGALLDDPDELLEVPGPNTRSARVLRLRSVDEVQARTPAIRSFVAGAVAAAREGRRVPPRSGELELCDEMQERLDADPTLQAAWEALTPGRRRGYHLHVSAAKQSATRARRFEGHVERIMAGKGLHDCICGRSKRMPRCDGSHKHAD